MWYIGVADGSVIDLTSENVVQNFAKLIRSHRVNNESDAHSEVTAVSNTSYYEASGSFIFNKLGVLNQKNHPLG